MHFKRYCVYETFFLIKNLFGMNQETHILTLSRLHSRIRLLSFQDFLEDGELLEIL